MKCIACDGWGENEVKGAGLLFMVNCSICDGTGVDENESPSGDDYDE